MNILIVNGSPKGRNSTTLQTVLYLELLHPEDSFRYLHAGQRIRSYEKDFSEPAAAIREADAVIFAYPVYTFLAPSQLHRFIALLKENGLSLEGKWVTQLTTSKHFYDVTAHSYVRDNCADLKAWFVKGLSADMEDLTLPRGRKEAEAFFDYFVWCAGHGVREPARPAGTAPRHVPVTPAEDRGEKAGDVVIVADLDAGDRQLADMIARFSAVCPKKTRLVNLREFPFKGGCVSCFHCASDGTCVYRDGFSELLREKIQTADAIVLAFSIKDHSMGSVFKTYDDRQFCNGHRTVTMGKPFGYLVSGNLSEEENLRFVLESRAEVGGNFLAGIAADEFDPDAEIDALAARLAYAVDRAYVQPANFCGVGGMKIFRDLIWQMQGMMRADHKFYKAHGQYDFPQKRFGRMLAMYPLGALMRSKRLKTKLGGKLDEGMLAPYQKALKLAEKRAAAAKTGK